MSSYISSKDVPYFYGRLLRDESEKILKKRGCSTGLYLLRERLEEAGSYALSVCHEKIVKHYKIDRQHDTTVKIDNGKSFIGPVELVNYHKIEEDGLATKLTKPCNLLANIEPVYYLFVHNSEFNHLVETEIQRTSLTSEDLKAARGRFRYKYERKILRKMHLTQSWFCNNIDREDATRILINQASKTEKF